jgi:hypothetical protein
VLLLSALEAYTYEYFHLPLLNYDLIKFVEMSIYKTSYLSFVGFHKQESSQEFFIFDLWVLLST